MKINKSLYNNYLKGLTSIITLCDTVKFTNATYEKCVELGEAIDGYYPNVDKVPKSLFAEYDQTCEKLASELFQNVEVSD